MKVKSDRDEPEEEEPNNNRPLSPSEITSLTNDFNQAKNNKEKLQQFIYKAQEKLTRLSPDLKDKLNLAKNQLKQLNETTPSNEQEFSWKPLLIGGGVLLIVIGIGLIVNRRRSKK